MTRLYTIGHSNHALATVLGLLAQHDVAVLADIRSQPWSRFLPHFRKRPFAGALEDAGIGYVFLGDALGGRPGPEFADESGRLDVTRRAAAEDFRAGVAHLLALARERPTAIMCAEEDPARCHRSWLVTPALSGAGVRVAHIRRDGRLEDARDDDAPDTQLTLFR